MGLIFGRGPENHENCEEELDSRSIREKRLEKFAKIQEENERK